MVLNIGELWDSPTSITEENRLLPFTYNAIDYDESERITFQSYDRGTYQSHERTDATYSTYFKILSPQQSYHHETNVRYNIIGYLGGCEIFLRENDGGERCPDDQTKSWYAKSADQSAFTPVVSTDLKGEINDPRGNNSINGTSGQSISPHASKSLRVRSSASKDRHSKVKTAKGLRDRIVWLSVSTALEFYNVKDRLGLDQPSKALDWLMTNAKAPIDELPEPSYVRL